MRNLLALITGLLISALCLAQSNGPEGITIPLDNPEKLEMVNVQGEAVEHKGKQGLRLMAADMSAQEELETLAIIPDVLFGDGIIELEVTGEPAAGAFPQARGFVGLAFRLNETDEEYSYECFYLRPTNGRAKIQAMRNHSIQYVSHPEFPWYRLRKESPEMYESYTDLVPGEWTKIRIEISGETGKLYVNDAPQPNLVVNDLKHGKTKGAVALWIHSSTKAHFRNLKIQPK